jgi:hypothetical protein
VSAPRKWFECEVALPSAASVEVYANDAGGLAAVLEVRNDRESLVRLEDALRGAVIEVTAARGRLP